jgi:hypothetical protein
VTQSARNQATEVIFSAARNFFSFLRLSTQQEGYLKRAELRDRGQGDAIVGVGEHEPRAVKLEHDVPYKRVVRTISGIFTDKLSLKDTSTTCRSTVMRHLAYLTEVLRSSMGKRCSVAMRG